MSETLMTYGTFVGEVADREEATLRERAALLYDVVYQAADEYIVSRGFCTDRSQVTRKFLGKKLAYVENDPNNRFKDALKRSRGCACGVRGHPC